MELGNIQSIHNYIAIIIANVFKSHPLQPDLIETVVRKLLLGNNLDEIVFLSECSENQNTIFTIINGDLLQNIQGSDEEKLLIQKLQDNEFKFLEKLLKDRKDPSLRKNAINSGIIEALHYIFTTRDMDEITYPHFLAFFQFTWPYSAEMSKILVDKKSFDFLLRLLDHKNLNIINESLNAMVNIIYGGTLGLDESQVHPYYEDLTQAGGIEKIYSLFKRNLSRHSQNSAAICLGIAFKSRIITDENMKLEIITHLKSISYRSDDEVNLALRCLAQNLDNHVEIVKEESAIDVSDNDDDKNKNEEKKEIQCLIQ
ncbi:MAG: hypothetical protein EZS28_023117 [Streblomastix strix]|uniref:Uncharacterized protein n=1 Tax=Streblomastix strix TaxID=222440 RepID=A0A5J4VFW7_9EUKA|nr:MAG: hypothetical protein EZS28_023117 [Streblomastix strix]